MQNVRLSLEPLMAIPEVILEQLVANTSELTHLDCSDGVLVMMIWPSYVRH